MTLPLETLAGRSRDRTLLVVSCGPSAIHWERVRASLPADTAVGCVKQAIFLCGPAAELHFFNAFNCQRYFPHNRHALRVSVVDEESPVDFNSADLTFSLDPATCTSLQESVAATGRFEDFTIEKSGLVKPWGPGIMYEAVVYLALHLGFREVHTVGWDVVREIPGPETESTLIEHFYDTKGRPAPAPRRDYEWAANPLLYRPKALARHWLGLPYNRMPKIDRAGEIPMIVRSLPRFFEWLESRGVALRVHSLLANRIVDARIRPYVIDLEALHSAPETSASTVRMEQR